LSQAAKWIEEGKLKPYINQTIKLEDAQNALDKLKEGKGGFGKVVVKLI
jgi:NADPH:quinone reductase-like Zn-dependent oxidoreductase